jgi:glycerate-2-kinase
MLIFAGETTVKVTGDGRGGRNQELALSAAIALDSRGDAIVLSIGTDGVDGPTPAAGAFGDAATVGRGREIGLDAIDHVARNDSYSYLSAIGDAVTCGPTGTNVGDLLLVARPA